MSSVLQPVDSTGKRTGQELPQAEDPRQPRLLVSDGEPHALDVHRRPNVRYLEVEEAQAPVRTPRRLPILWALVMVPFVLAAIYLLLFAADRYTSETSFVIREGVSSGSQAMTTGGLARNDDSSHAIVAYLKSRDATADLSSRFDLPALFARSEADFLTRYPRPWTSASLEALHRHLQGVLNVDFDSRSGITTLQILAYRSADAEALAAALLDEAEHLINRMNERASQDAIAFASSMVADGEARIRDIQTRLSNFRTEAGMIDPAAQSGAQLALVTELTQSATGLDTEIAQLRSSAGQSPRLPALIERRAALTEQINELRGDLAGSAHSLAPKIGAYEVLALERELAVRSLTASYRSLEQARQEAAASRLYLQRISAPNIADRPSHPRILLNLAVVLAVSFGLFWILRSVLRATMEHRF